MEIVIKEKQAFMISGIDLRTSNRNGESLRQIPLFWQRFYKERIAEKVPGAIRPEVVYALYSDYDEQGYYSMLLGVEVRELHVAPSPWTCLKIQQARYAVLTAKGQVPYAVPAAWEYVFSHDFSHTRAFHADFEVYDGRSKNIRDAEVDLYISILDMPRLATKKKKP